MYPVVTVVFVTWVDKNLSGSNWGGRVDRIPSLFCKWSISNVGSKFTILTRNLMTDIDEVYPNSSVRNADNKHSFN